MTECPAYKRPRAMRRHYQIIDLLQNEYEYGARYGVVTRGPSTTVNLTRYILLVIWFIKQFRIQKLPF